MKRSNESGQVLPLVALCFAMLTGFAGMGVDVGYWEYQQRQQQSATDAAAIGAAQQLLYSGCPSQANATTAGQKDAADNGFTNGSNGVTVSIANPPTTGYFSGNTCAAMAQIQASKVPAFFTRLFGYLGSGNTTMHESTQAVAMVTANNDGCIYMLTPGQNTNFHGSTITAPGCAIYMNGSANFNGATVDAQAIGEANYAGSNNGGTFTGASPTQIPPVADPCPEIAGCANLTSSPPSTSPCNGTYGGNGSLPAGCYKDLNANGATITLGPGTIVLEGSANFNGASISGSGVTIYMAAGASANFNKVNSMTLSPPTTGSYAEVTYFQPASNSNDINFNGSNTNISGLVYAPSAQMNWNGSNGGYAVIVAAYANFNNSNGQSYGSPPVNGSLIKKVVLAQ
jgi:hypothetical protein